MLNRIIGLLIIGLISLWLPAGPALAQEPITPQHTAAGWVAWYWNNTSLAGPPVLQRSEANLDFNWGSGSPDPAISTNGFSARWTRYIDVPPGAYRFTATSDDGIRVWLDGELIIDRWDDHAVTTVRVDRNLSAGHHLLTVEYYENQDQAVVRVSFAPATATIRNWRGEYFNNTTLSGQPSLVRDDAQINFNWGTGSPAPGPLRTDRFSVRWTRTLNLAPGSYRFSMTVDDGGRLWVNNHLLIDAWRDQNATTHTGEIYLPGGRVPIKMEYYDNSGYAVARMRWVAADAPPPATGWLGQYYPNRDLAGPPTLTRVDPDLRFDWGTGAPAPGLPVDNFSVRWTRDIYFPEGTYNFFAQHDDGMRVWVDGALVVDSWYDQAAMPRSGTYSIDAGVHHFRVEYYEHADEASITVGVSPGTGAPPPSAPPGTGTEVLLDNTDAGFQWGGSMRARYVASQGIGGSSYWTYNSGQQPYNYGKWTPRLPAPGKYEIWAYLPRDYGDSSYVRYRVLHNNQRDDQVISQRRYSDQWVSLGTYIFNAANGGGEFVLVYDNTGESDTTHTIAFDALKFVLVNRNVETTSPPAIRRSTLSKFSASF